jgi:hypothetical protein
MNEKTYRKIAPYSTVFIGVALVTYNFLLIQNPKYSGVATYFIAGAIFIGTAIALAVNRSLGIRLYALLTWGTTVFFGYTILLVIALLANPLFLLLLLSDEKRLLTYGVQIGIYIGLIIYMHKTRKRLSAASYKITQSSQNQIPLPPGRTPSALVKESGDAKWYMRAWVIVLTSLLVPPLGVVLMWRYAPWGRGLKQIITVPLIFTSAVFFVAFAGVLRGMDGQVGTEKLRMEKFLEQKYSKKFDVRSGKISRGGDALFGVSFKTYKAGVSPRDNPNMTFEASRIVSGESLDGGANDPDIVNYHDEYLMTLWANELRGEVEAVARKSPASVTDFSFRVSLAKNRQARADFYQTIWGTVPQYKNLSSEQKNMLTYVTELKSHGVVNSSNISDHAKTMLAVKNVINPSHEKISMPLKYEVYQNTSDKKPKWEYRGRFTEANSVEDLLPQFIEWGERTGKYYNMKTKKFDLAHPNSP